MFFNVLNSIFLCMSLSETAQCTAARLGQDSLEPVCVTQKKEKERKQKLASFGFY